jgi:Rab9 effector protein with kelch motifs
MEFNPYLESGLVPNDSFWYVLPACGESPALRVGHTSVQIGATKDSNGYLYVIGGANPSGTFSDVYALDLDTYIWSKRESTGFAGRYEHTAFVAISEPSNIYIFGGADGDGNRNDIQVYNTDMNSWRSVETSGVPPQARTFHNGVCVGNQLVVYGGGERGPDPVSDRKVHIFDAVKRHWSVLEVRGDAPKPRHGHVMAAIDNRVFLHGGMAGPSFFDDLHILDLAKSSWFHAKIKSVKPSARAAHGSFVTASDLYIFGGMNQNGALCDMFKLDTSKWCASFLYLIMCFLGLIQPAASCEHPGKQMFTRLLSSGCPDWQSFQL